MGRLTSIQTGSTAAPMSVQDLQYVWQSGSFPLLRQDRRNTTSTTDDYRDVYNYDDMGRMYRQQTDLSVNRISNFAYDVLGNLTSKTSSVAGDLNVTGYTYATAGKPHRLTSVNIGGVGNTLSYNNNGSITQYDAASGNDTFLSYDGQNNVQSVTVGTSSSTPTPKAKDEFWYTPDGDRFLGRETWDASGVQRVAITTYLGAFEEVKPNAESSYNLFRRVQVTPTVMWKWRSVSSGATATDWMYQHRDHLGSMDAMTDGTGVLVSSVVGKTSFDPFGGRRSKDWSKDITPAELQALLFVDYEDEKSPRGYTDHEMLNRTGFIHMNGRVYDPRIGRFVSADPIVQAPTFSQSYNRYAYVMNNPMAYTDPSGYFLLGDTNFVCEQGEGSCYDELDPTRKEAFDAWMRELSEITAPRYARAAADALEGSLAGVYDEYSYDGNLLGAQVAVDDVAMAVGLYDGRSLPRSLSTTLAPYFPGWYDLSQIRLYDGLPFGTIGNPLARTIGNDIYFSEGAYSPNTASGIALIGHEIGHAVQSERDGASKYRTTYAREYLRARRGLFGQKNAHQRALDKVSYEIEAGKAEQKILDDLMRRGYPYE